MKIILLSIAIIFGNTLLSQTNIGGVLSSNTTLMLSDSPFIVTNNLLVMEGVSVDVEPGVQFFFDEGIYLRIDGLFRAIGTEQDSILFSKNDGANGWAGINFTDISIDYNTESGSGSILSHCIVEYTTDYGNNGGAIWTTFASPKISDCEIKHFHHGVSLHERGIFIDNSIHDGQFFPLISAGTDSTSFQIVQGNEIYNCNGGSNSAITLLNTNFDNNYIHNVGDLIAVRVRTFCVVTNNIFNNIPNTALSILGGDDHFVGCNTFENNGINLVISCERYPNISNNNFINYLDYHVYWAEMYWPFGNDGCILPKGSGVYATIDLSNNYWGGLTDVQMDESIWDFNDDFSLKALIDYEPVLLNEVDISSTDCSSPSSIYQQTIENDFEVSLYPNPSNSVINIELKTSLLKDDTEVRLFTSSGSEILRVNMKNKTKLEIHKEDIGSGVYILQVYNGYGLIYNSKVVIL